MWLHPRHLEGGRAAPLQEARLRSAPRARRFGLLEAIASESAAALGEVPRLAPASLRRPGLVVGDGEAGRAAAHVPVLLAEVAHAACPHNSDVSVLALAVRSTSTSEGMGHVEARFLWLLIVEGGVEELRCQLHLLGKLGALRNDFSEDFVPNGIRLSPMSETAVFKVQPRFQVCLEGAGNDGAPRPLVAKVTSCDGTEKDKEVELLQRAQGHPNILGLHATFFSCLGSAGGPSEIDAGKPCHILVTSLGSTDLRAYVKQQGVMSEGRGLQTIEGVLSAIAHMHRLGVVHRDVKPESVLLGFDGAPLLADFGMAASLSDKKAMQTPCGTPGFAAPELLEASRYDEKVDVFGAGAVLYHVLEGSTPFAQRPGQGRSAPERHLHFRSRRPVGRRVRELLRILLAFGKDERPSAAAALQMLGLAADLERSARDAPLLSRRRRGRGPAVGSDEHPSEQLGPAPGGPGCAWEEDSTWSSKEESNDEAEGRTGGAGSAPREVSEASVRSNTSTFAAAGRARNWIFLKLRGLGQRSPRARGPRAVLPEERPADERPRGAEHGRKAGTASEMG